MRISEIFQSIEGEGKYSGYVSTFIRLFGCNLNCSWCDSLYTKKSKDYIDMDISEILETVQRLHSPCVTLTGGEPLLYIYDVVPLLTSLASLKFIHDIHIETNGSVNLDPILQLRDTILYGEKIRFIIDYKLPDSNMEEYMCLENYSKLSSQDELKFVINSKSDLEKTFQMIHIFTQDGFKGLFLLSPVFGKISPKIIVNRMLKECNYNVKFNLQIHKLIWDANERGV